MGLEVAITDKDVKKYEGLLKEVEEDAIRKRNIASYRSENDGGLVGLMNNASMKYMGKLGSTTIKKGDREAADSVMVGFLQTALEQVSPEFYQGMQSAMKGMDASTKRDMIFQQASSLLGLNERLLQSLRTDLTLDGGAYEAISTMVNYATSDRQGAVAQEANRKLGYEIEDAAGRQKLASFVKDKLGKRGFGYDVGLDVIGNREFADKLAQGVANQSYDTRFRESYNLH